MSLIFFSTPSFAIPSLKKLFYMGEDITLVITQPDRVGGRGHKRILPSVKIASQEFGLRVLQPEKIKSTEFLNTIKELHSEFLIVVAYGKVIPKELLSIPERGCINLHASLLPNYRGAAPIQWSLINGEKKTGITTILMDEGLDTGDILLQREVEITEGDDAETLSQRLSIIGAELLTETLRGIRSGKLAPRPQVGKSSFARVLNKEDGLIDWILPARMVFNRVRGLYPWPCAYTYFHGKMVKLFKVKVLSGSGYPGEIVQKGKKELIVATSDGLVKILELQIEGKKRMDISAFLQGQGKDINVGDRFGELQNN